MAVKKQALAAAQLKGLLKTRRTNQIENSNLAARLKVLDLKKTQVYTQMDMERDSLRQDIQKIQHIKKDVPVSAERRKLFRSGSRGNDNIQVDTESRDYKSGLEGMNSGLPINQRSQKVSGKAESPVVNSYQAERHSRRDSTKSPGTDSGNVRARHHFRLIDPPNRPGSRRNFLPVPDKVLQKEQQELNNHSLHKEGTVPFDKNRTSRGRSLSDTSIGSSSKQEVVSPTSANVSALSKISNALSTNESGRIRRSVSWYETRSGLATTSPCDATGRVPGSSSSEQIIDSDEIFENATGISLVENPALFPDETNTSFAKHPAHRLMSHWPTTLKHRPQTSPSHRKSSHVGQASQKRHTPASAGTEQKMMTEDADLLYSMRCRSCSKSCPNLNLADFNDIVTRHSTKNIPCSRSQQPHKPKSTKLCGRRGYSFTSTQETRAENDIVRKHSTKDKPCSRSQQPSQPSSKNLCGRRGYSFTSTRDRSGPANKTKQDEGVYIYDARPNRSLSKGYQKMQVTIGKKQLSINMPRFSSNTDEPALARMRTQFISEQFQPRLLAKLTASKR